MANEDKKDFNAMLHENKDMPKVQIVTEEKTIAKYGGERMYFAPPLAYDAMMKRVPSGKLSCALTLRVTTMPTLPNQLQQASLFPLRPGPVRSGKKTKRLIGAP